MKMTDHLIGDRVSVRCRRSYRPGDTEVSWLGGTVIASARDGKPGASAGDTRYVIQLEDDRRVVAFDPDVRRWTLAFDIVERLEKMAS